MKRGRVDVGQSGESSVGAFHTESSELKFTPLGSGNEVGRSCHLLEFKGKQVLLDCGIHPGKKGENALPYFDTIDPSKVDLLLITHFHLDHVGSLPYFTEKTDFKGEIYMTRPTRVVSELLLKDYVRINLSAASGSKDRGGSSTSKPATFLYDAKDVSRCLAKCRTLDYHQEISIGGIKFCAYNAGHVLGAAMFLIEISGVRIFYTGDYSREEDRHLMKAEVPSPKVQPDLLVMESTFGTLEHEGRKEREERFTTCVENIVKRGGRCLIPVFALGRAQELLLILEDHWKKNPSLHSIPIYHNAKVATKALEVYRTYINMMNGTIRKDNRKANPWKFSYIYPLNTSLSNQREPAVIMASPGFLQSGASRQLFDSMCTDERNGVILAGYSVEGTLAHKLATEGALKEVTSLSGRVLPLNCQVENISFAAHTDVLGSWSFVQELVPKNIVLVHGDTIQMRRLRNYLKRRCAEMDNLEETTLFSPQNTQAIKLEFFEERIVKAMGGLAAKRTCPDGTRIAGLLVRQDFQEKFLLPEDLNMYTPLCTTKVMQQLHLPFHADFARLVSCVGKLFQVSGIEALETSDKKRKKNKMMVHESITLTHTIPPGRVLMEWEATPSADMIADAITSLLMQAEGSIAGIRLGGCCSCKHKHEGHTHATKTSEKGSKSAKETNSGCLILVALLRETFGTEDVEVTIAKKKAISVKVTDARTQAQVRINFTEEDGAVGDITLEGEDDGDVLGTIKKLVASVEQVTCPLPPFFHSNNTAAPALEDAEKDAA